MNVLITVFTILMMVAALTYARLETFLDFNSTHVAQREYMRGSERKVYNALQKKLWEDDKKSKEKSKEKDKDKEQVATIVVPDEEVNENPEINYYNENAEAIKEEMVENAQKKEHLLSHIDWNILVNQKELDNKELFDKTLELSKRLIVLLYGNQPFFLEAKQKYSNLEDLILLKVIEGSLEYRQVDNQEKQDKPIVDKNKKEIKFTRKSQLAEIPFDDEDLRLIYCKMLKGTRGKKERKLIGYPSLLDFVTISKNRPLSLYLAPEEILFCLFQSDEIANQIKAERSEIYNAIRNGSLNCQDGEQRFQAEYEGKLSTDFRAPFVTFKTSKSDPKAFD